MHFDLERRAQPLSDEIDGFFLEEIANLHAFGRTGAKQPCDIVAARAADPLVVENGCAVADLLHLRSAQIIAQTGMADKKHREEDAGIGHHFHAKSQLAHDNNGDTQHKKGNHYAFPGKFSSLKWWKTK